MKELQIKGTQNFLGVNIPIIEGGFGENQKVILAKTVAEIHDVKLKCINELINKNIDEFELGVDILDLKTTISPNFANKIKLFIKNYQNSDKIYQTNQEGKIC